MRMMDNIHIPSGGEFRPAISRESLPSQIYHALRLTLMQGRFLPGEKLKLRDLAREFTVSPTPVREALVRLIGEGALEQSDNRSVRVPRVDPDLFRETCELRMELESRAVTRAAENPTPQDIAILSELHAKVESARQQERTVEVIAANRSFHIAICRIGGGPVLNQIVEGLWLRCGPVLHTVARMGPVHPFGDHPHDQVIRGIAGRDADLARLALQRDITVFMDKALRNIDAINSSADAGEEPGS